MNRLSPLALAPVVGCALALGCASAKTPSGADSSPQAGATSGSSNAAYGGAGATPDPGGGAGGSVDGSGGAGGSERASHRFSIEFDYRFDRLGYFDDDARRQALEAAALRWSSAVANDFPTVPAGTRICVNDPENRDEQACVDELEHDIDDVLVFVGTSEKITGFGRSGPAASAQSADAELVDSLRERWTGKAFAPWAGSITIKGSTAFFFDSSPTTASDIPADEVDFISVVTHELGHVLGFATAPAFMSHVSHAEFDGRNAEAEYGGPVPLEPDSNHLADGTESGGEEAIMTPRLPPGLRQSITPLDRAVMVDLGYDRAE